jgi:hypothetical protein
VCIDCQYWNDGSGIDTLIDIQQEALDENCFHPLIKYSRPPSKCCIYSGFLLSIFNHITTILSTIISVIMPNNLTLTIFFLILSLSFDIIGVYCNRCSLSSAREWFLTNSQYKTEYNTLSTEVAGIPIQTANTWWNRYGNTLFWPLLGILSAAGLAIIGQLQNGPLEMIHFASEAQNNSAKLFLLAVASVIADLIISTDSAVRSGEVDKLLEERKRRLCKIPILPIIRITQR